MNKNTDQDPQFSYQRPVLKLDRENKKVLGVCSGFARYLEVPPALVRVIFVVACLVSPFLILVYLLLYWLLEDEKRPGRIKEALSSYMPGQAGSAQADANSRQSDHQTANQGQSNGHASMDAEPARRFDLKKPLYRSRRNVRIGGVCAGLADYLNVNAFFVRLVTFASIFILGGITFWVYVICWIVLDKEPKSLQKSRRGSAKSSGEIHPESSRADAAGSQAFDTETIKACAERLQATEQRLRSAEAFITSRQFRLHCEINRI
ncbi:MAG: PspC domain-containing protein [Pseudohongiella sp.]|nr:PspC domain-containing protein [Pseudohongiella sp.]MDO9520011.1 PspC domain-containing protein [Pseudohongiella sp.]